MTIEPKIKLLVEKMISCHNTYDFNTLSSLMDISTLEAEDTYFTEDKFIEVSDKIKQNLGSLKSVEFIGYLSKNNSIQTLWKAKYSMTQDEILWQAFINLNEKEPKIIQISVN